MPIKISSGDPAFDALPDAVAQWIDDSSLTLALGAQPATGFRSGNAPVIELGTQAQALAAAIYYSTDVTSALDVFLKAPLPDGALYHSFAPLTALVGIQKLLGSLFCGAGFDDHLRAVRLGRNHLCNDVESLAVLGVQRAWKANGDLAWLRNQLPILDRAINNRLHHIHHWSSEMELPKRAFTLDRWPVEWGSDAKNSCTFSDDTKWCVHPGDAAALFEACQALAKLHAATGDLTSESHWLECATHLEAQTNSVCWNGQFYTHQIHLVPARVRGVDEARQLASCNTRAMVSGLASQEQCAAIIKEYQRRRELLLETSFCEWWSIQPPFPEGAFPIAPGVSANGGIWPRVGGELALAALEHGFENYGVETLRRFHDLAVKSGRTFPSY
ncbi:MAG TPA: hypothetical protein VF719_09955, partial [Abditibacteriaceae bacterium]